ncbi:hypothetical protein OOT08_12570, partial [Leucobacter sp. M11]|nr:hypothetical protein [Leucobacter sp. M11]
MNHRFSPDVPHGAAGEPAAAPEDVLYTLADQLAGLLGGSVAIEDIGRRILAYSTLPGLAMDEVRAEGILRREVPDSPGDDALYERVLGAEAALWLPSTAAEAARIAAPIRADGAPIGSVWAILPDPSAPAAAALAAVAETAGLAAAPVLDRLEATAARRRPQDRRFAEALGDARPRARLGSLLPAGAAEHRMLLFGLDPDV